MHCKITKHNTGRYIGKHCEISKTNDLVYEKKKKIVASIIILTTERLVEFQYNCHYWNKLQGGSSTVQLPSQKGKNAKINANLDFVRFKTLRLHE